MNMLGYGFLESIYQNALVVALTDSGLNVLTDRGFEVSFLGEYQAQLINYLAVAK